MAQSATIYNFTTYNFTIELANVEQGTYSLSAMMGILLIIKETAS